MRKCLLMILAMSLLALTMLPAQASTPPGKLATPPASTQPEKLYTEDEALLAAKAYGSAALDKAIPLAVQAAIAEERGKAAVLEAQRDGYKEVLAMATKGKQDAELQARRLRDGIAWGCAGAAVLVSAAFIFGAWAGLSLR